MIVFLKVSVPNATEVRAKAAQLEQVVMNLGAESVTVPTGGATHALVPDRRGNMWNWRRATVMLPENGRFRYAIRT